MRDREENCLDYDELYGSDELEYLRNPTRIGERDRDVRVKFIFNPDVKDPAKHIRWLLGMFRLNYCELVDLGDVE